jgi:hypothetical protein
MGVVAAVGLRAVRDWILRAGPSLWPGLVRAIIIFAILAIVFATELWTKWAGGFAEYWSSLAPPQLKWIGPAQLTSMLVIAAIILAIVIPNSASRRVPSLLVAAFCVILAWVDYSLVAPFVQDAEIRSESPLHARESSPVRRFLQHSRPDARVLARHQNAVSLCGVATVPVYLGIGPSEYFAGPLRVPDDFHWESTLSTQTLQWLDWSGVTHVLAFDPIASDSLELIWADYDPFLHKLLGRPAWQPLMLYELRSARGRAYSVPIDQLHYALDPHGSPNSLRQVQDIHRSANETEFAVECDEHSVAVLTELMYPGWRVYVDDRPFEAVAGTVFRAVEVAPGRHMIRWVYRPASLRIGVIATLLSVAGTCVFYWHHRTPAGATAMQ